MVGMVKEDDDARLKLKLSPDQISHTIAMGVLWVNHETIYQYITRDE